MRLLRLAMFATALLATQAQAGGVFANPHKGYSFQTPGGWQLAHPDFMLTSPSGASLSESDLPPKGERNIQQISKTAGMIACIGADYEDTRQRFDLSGEDWQGLVSVYLEPRRHNRQPRHVLQLVAQHGDIYRLFYLAVPSTEWLGDPARVREILGGLRFNR